MAWAMGIERWKINGKITTYIPMFPGTDGCLLTEQIDNI